MSADDLLRVASSLADDVDALRFAPPVHTVYNPLRYAWPMHEVYVRRFGEGQGRVLFLGMNPGPWGMAQTGVPFGEVAAVRDWMGLSAPVAKPAVEHPKRPITGLATTRSEVSGRRLWGWAAERFGTAEAFFARAFVANWCPLVFMDDGGRNVVPDKLPVAELTPLTAACDAALSRVIDALAPSVVVGVGAFARDRARAVAAGRVKVAMILHPSPASPRANQGWAAQAERELAEQGVGL